ncbi:MAG: hypothetical protein Q7T82_12370 [Armatimonadota bacterium]|nr:hypothetical protein [Armatimonadota bacterium]
MRVISTLFALVLLAFSTAFASDGDVTLAGRVVLRIRYPAAGYTIAERADAVQIRLNEVLGMGPIQPEDVKIKRVNKETAIVVKDQLIITVDWTTARANKTTPEKLGQIWAANLRSALPEVIPRGVNHL